MPFLKGKDLLFIAGGIGLAPLRSVINYVRDNRQNYGAIQVIYGARSIYFKNGQRKQRAIFSISAIKQQGRFFSCLGLFHVELETKHQYPTL